MMKTYYLLTKPGIILGNIVTTVAGFALASKGHIDFSLFFATLLGLSLIIASACVLNNYMDRKSDGKMSRTKNRAFVTGLVSVPNAMMFILVLGLCGIIVLALFTNLLTVFIALTGFFVYIVLYGILKYRTTYGTIVGSIAGGIPPVVGYCAVSNHFDIGAMILFLIMVMWQMPHFFAIAMYLFDDYVAASIPVLPVMKGMNTTKIHMIFYIITFMIAAGMLTLFGYTGYAYLSVGAILGMVWLGLCLSGFKSQNDKLWARSMFRFSLVNITGLCFMIAIDYL